MSRNSLVLLQGVYEGHKRASRMAIGNKRTRQSLETGGPIAFGIGGSAILLNVILLTVLSDAVPGWLNTVLGLGGMWVTALGLVGFYSLVADTSPRLSLAGVLAGALGWILLTVGLGWGIVLDLTNQGTIAEGPPLGAQFFLTAIVLILLSFLLYGAASYRTDSPSRRVGLLMLIPFLTFLLLVAIFVTNAMVGFEPPDSVFTVLFGIAAVGLLAVGYVLWTAPSGGTGVTGG